MDEVARDPKFRALLELTRVKGTLPALLLLDQGPHYAKQLSIALGISEETANRLRAHLLGLRLITVEKLQVGGAEGDLMSLTAAGRRAAKGVGIIAASLNSTT